MVGLKGSVTIQMAAEIKILGYLRLYLRLPVDLLLKSTSSLGGLSSDYAKTSLRCSHGRTCDRCGAISSFGRNHSNAGTDSVPVRSLLLPRVEG